MVNRVYRSEWIDSICGMCTVHISIYWMHPGRRRAVDCLAHNAHIMFSRCTCAYPCNLLHNHCIFILCIWTKIISLIWKRDGAIWCRNECTRMILLFELHHCMHLLNMAKARSCIHCLRVLPIFLHIKSRINYIKTLNIMLFTTTRNNGGNRYGIEPLMMKWACSSSATTSARVGTVSRARDYYK